MEEKNNKIILSVLIVVLIIIAIVLVVLIATKDKKQIQPIQQQLKTPTETIDGITPLTEEKREELAAIKNTIGTLTSVDIAKITIITPEGDLELKVPQQGASFVNQTTQEDGSFLIEEVGLFELPTDKEVEIQYNSSSNEVMLVTVK